MEFAEMFSCIVFGILSVACMVYMIKTDAKSKRANIHQRIDELAAQMREYETVVIKAECAYWKKKAGEITE